VVKTKIEHKARSFAKRHGFQVRRVPHSTAYPNGYVKVIDPAGKEHVARDMVEVMDVIYRLMARKEQNQ
jgi:hypothetical protein